MKLNKFVEESIVQVLVGIKKFNDETLNARAEYPDKIEFELYVSGEGDITNSSCGTKITFSVPVNKYKDQDSRFLMRW